VTPEEVRFQLERILASRVFVSSARMSRFLRCSVEETLAGRGEELKETTIGLAVYDRATDYDPRVDPIVRVEARRLREKLSQYYETDGREDSIVIELQATRPRSANATSWRFPLLRRPQNGWRRILFP
jgi:hypothetical protein